MSQTKNIAASKVTNGARAPITKDAFVGNADAVAKLQAQLAALTAERDALLVAPTVKPTPAPAAAPIFTMPPAATSALAASTDMLASLGIELPSWKQVAFSGVLLIAAVMGAYIASPILASILVAGTATVTASGFALWVASALGYLIATWASFKAAKGVASAVGWLAQYIPAPAVLAAKS